VRGRIGAGEPHSSGGSANRSADHHFRRTAQHPRPVHAKDLLMTEAERIADDLGERGHRRMMKHVVLSNQTLPLAYNAVVHDGVVAKRSPIPERSTSPRVTLTPLRWTV
jgi:hypothetical protein